MYLKSARARDRLYQQLTDGTLHARQNAARSALPTLASTLHRIRDQKAAAQVRFAALGDAATESGKHQPSINPILDAKSRQLRFWAPVILVVEFALSTYVATLTISGGLALHLVAGFLMTALLCGLGKIAVQTQLDEGRLLRSAAKLERQLLRVVMVTALMLLVLFVSRFFAFADLAFALGSTFLSFAVAYLVALAWALGYILGAANREVSRYTHLAWQEDEVARIEAVAHALVDEEPETPRSKHGLTVVMALLLLSAQPATTEASSQTLQLWVDVSGSLAADELDAVRTGLADPRPAIEALRIRQITLAPFATERDVLRAPPHRWDLPALRLPECTGSPSLFKTTAAERKARCDDAREQARQAWEADMATAVDAFGAALRDLAPVEAEQTCLYPLLTRLARSQGFHVVITDGAHTKCGLEPELPTPLSAVVILVPDEGTEIAARMEERRTTLERLFPGIRILPSWQLWEQGSAWQGVLGDQAVAREPQ